MLTELSIFAEDGCCAVSSCTHAVAPTPSRAGWSTVAFQVHLPIVELCSSQLTLLDFCVSSWPESPPAHLWDGIKPSPPQWVSVGQWALLVLCSLLSTACSTGG